MSKQKISFLIPVTSRGREFTVDTLPLYSYFLSSFDFDKKYDYKIFLGSDSDDDFYNHKDVIHKIQNLPNVSIQYFNDTSHNPVRVWNYLFKTAYEEGFDYFYQLGDDIQIITNKSIDRFIETLQSIDNIGVTGPLDINHPNLLTQSFVHRTHMDIFGFYYPHELTNWYCDNWIQEVYKPGRTIQLPDVYVRNSGGPCRYTINRRTDFMKFVERDRQILYNYINDNS